MRKAYTELMHRKLIAPEVRDDLVQVMVDGAKQLEVEYPSSSDEENLELKKQRTGDTDEENSYNCPSDLLETVEKHTKNNMATQDLERFG